MQAISGATVVELEVEEDDEEDEAVVTMVRVLDDEELELLDDDELEAVDRLVPVDEDELELLTVETVDTVVEDDVLLLAVVAELAVERVD